MYEKNSVGQSELHFQQFGCTHCVCSTDDSNGLQNGGRNFSNMD